MKGLADFCLTMARAILSDFRVRRQWMFYLTLGVLAFVFGGYFLAFDFMKRHPVVFGAYLLISLAGLGFLILFAAFDLLVVRRAYREAHRAVMEEARRDIMSLQRPKTPDRPPTDGDSETG